MSKYVDDGLSEKGKEPFSNVFRNWLNNTILVDAIASGKDFGTLDDAYLLVLFLNLPEDVILESLKDAEETISDASAKVAKIILDENSFPESLRIFKESVSRVYNNE